LEKSIHIDCGAQKSRGKPVYPKEQSFLKQYAY